MRKLHLRTTAECEALDPYQVTIKEFNRRRMPAGEIKRKELKTMKKLTKLIAMCLAAMMLLALTGAAQADNADLAAKLEAAAKMTDEELYAEAQNEKGTMQIYSTTSLAANTVESLPISLPMFSTVVPTASPTLANEPPKSAML